MTRQAYVLHDHRLVVFWARKAACTSVVDTILFDILGQDSDAFARAKLRKRRWLSDHGHLYDYFQAASLIESKRYRSIAMIREPYERLISVFLNIFVRPQGNPVRQFDDLAWYSKQLYSEITGETPKSKRLEFHGLSFFEFVTAVCDKIERRRRDSFRGSVLPGRIQGVRRLHMPPWSAEPRLNPHWNTQIPFWYLSTGFEYDHLFSTDRSAAFFQTLSDLTGCDIEEKRSNRFRYAHADTSVPERDLVHVGSLDYSGDPTAMNRAFFASDQLQQKVKRSFAPDYHYYRKRAD